MKQPRPTRPPARGPAAPSRNPETEAFLPPGPSTASLAPPVPQPLSTPRFRLNFVPLRSPPLPSPRLRPPPGPATRSPPLTGKVAACGPAGSRCRDEPQRPQLPHGLPVRGGPAPRRDGGDALREVQPGRAHPLHPGLQGYDHPPLLGLRVRELSTTGGR